MLGSGFGKIDVALGVVAEEVIVCIARIERGFNRVNSRVADGSRRKTLNAVGVIGIKIDLVIEIAEYIVFVYCGDVFLGGIHLQLRIGCRIVETVVKNRGNDLHLRFVLCLALND